MLFHLLIFFSHFFTRGVIFPSGVLLKQDKENPDRCILHRVVGVDPKGSIPVSFFFFFFFFFFSLTASCGRNGLSR